MNPEPVHPPAIPPARPEPARRSLLAQAIVDTFTQRGARLGAAWIAIILLFAVFAPFIANSFPIAVQLHDGSWRFPLLANLTSADIAVLFVFFAGVAMLLARRPLRLDASRFMTGLALATVIALPAASAIARPPRNPVYEAHREMQARGEFRRVIRAIIPYSANDRLNDRPAEKLQPPGGVHWLGTTIFGEDMLSRMIHATRVALTIGVIATGISAVLGILIGGLMGYFAGPVDLFGMRLIEIIQAIPRLVLLLIITAFYGPGIYRMMVVIGLLSWTGNARFIRAEFLKLRKLDFVQAGIAAGLPLRSILFRHMLPNGVAPVLVDSSFSIAAAILIESTLSFLGLGLGPEDPSWGQLLNQARAGGTGFNWWIATFPGLAIFLTVFAYILIGEAIRDALDPTLMKRD